MRFFSQLGIWKALIQEVLVVLKGSLNTEFNPGIRGIGMNPFKVKM